MAMIRTTVAALAATGALAQWVETDAVKELAAGALDRRQSLAAHRRRGDERGRRTAAEGGMPSDGRRGVWSRALKRARTPDARKSTARWGDSVKEAGWAATAQAGGGATALIGDLTGITMGAASKTGKYSKSETSSGDHSSGKSDKASGDRSSSKSEKDNDDHSSSKSGKAKSGKYAKSRRVDPAESNICTKRLGIAYDDITALGPEGPFGTIMTPSDVTDLCRFVPPEEGEDPNFGCPFLFVPGFGFLEGEDYIDVFDEVPGRAFRSLALYCECYQGFDLGCAAKVPHGPPMSTIDYTTPDGEPREAFANGYSEFIPHSNPAVRAEYCKMVGVWNGDFDADVAEDLPEDVTDCGCYFTGQARDMVSQCPGVDLGAFFVFPDPTSSPTPDLSAITFYDSFEDGTFANGDGWSVETVDGNVTTVSDMLVAAAGDGNMEAGMLVAAALVNGRARRLQGGGELPVWELSTERAYDGQYSIKSPDLGEFEDAYILASAELSSDASWQTPGWLSFALFTDFENSDDRFNSVVWYVDGEPNSSVSDSADWTTHRIYLGPGQHTVTWEYWHLSQTIDDNNRPAAFIDEVFFKAGTPIPTYSPTNPAPSESPTLPSSSYDPTLGP